MYTVTYSKMERVAIALLTANVDKECEFIRYLKHLLAQPNVQKYMRSQDFQVSKLQASFRHSRHTVWTLPEMKPGARD